MASSLPLALGVYVVLILAHCGVPGAEGCVQCGAQFKNLKSRFARLCAQFQSRYPRANCTKYPWGRGAVRGFAIDEASLDLLLEKTHRVFRVIEINQSLADFPKYWNWLHEVKMREQTREALCPPACQGAATVFNCSTCRRTDVPCWDLQTCYPERRGLKKVVVLLSSISCSCLFLGLISCALEFWLRPGIGSQ